MKVPLVDQRYLDWLVAKLQHCLEAAESSTDHDYAVIARVVRDYCKIPAPRHRPAGLRRQQSRASGLKAKRRVAVRDQKECVRAVPVVPADHALDVVEQRA